MWPDEEEAPKEAPTARASAVVTKDAPPARATGAGATKAAAPQNECWDATSRVPARGAAHSPKLARYNARNELRRFAALKSVRSVYARCTTPAQLKRAVPPLAFERWLARFSLGSSEEPVLPTTRSIDALFVEDLSRSFSSRDAAAEVVRIITDASADAAEKLRKAWELDEQGGPQDDGRKLLKSVRKTAKALLDGAEDEEAAWGLLAGQAAELSALATSKAPVAEESVSTARTRDGVVLMLGSLKPYMRLNGAHYEKLRQLHARHGGGEEEEAGEAFSFDELAFSVVARYEGLRGAGFQCAVPGAAFDALIPHLGQTIECFASPLNARYERYFSAWPELESRLGSLGNFFSDQATLIFSAGGSFEANPPFVPEVMEAMLARIIELLLATVAKPLSFLVVLPDWGGGKSVARAAERSTYKVAGATLRADEHVFADGAQHRVDKRYRPSSWATSCTLLQNAAGKKKWPLGSEVLLATLKDAMSRSASEPGSSKKEDIYSWEESRPRPQNHHAKSAKRNNHASSPAAKRPRSTSQ